MILFSSKLTCDWADNVPSNQVIFDTVDGERYMGIWINYMAHGKGKYTYSDQGAYEGQWKFDFPHGEGVETYPDKSSYSGTGFSGAFILGKFRYGKKHGFGVMKFKDGAVYEGHFE